jgi:hypothetical protein
MDGIRTGYGLRLEVVLCHFDVSQKARVRDVSCRIGAARLSKCRVRELPKARHTILTPRVWALVRDTLLRERKTVF